MVDGAATTVGAVTRIVRPRLLLVRHGQSEWNALGRWQGHADPPLTPFGVAQARHAAAHLTDLVHRVVSSDLTRAAHTADILAEGRPVPPPERRPALRERAAGPWQGRTRAEIDAGWPGFLDNGLRPEGFETDDELLDRVIPDLVALAHELADTVAEADPAALVVTHGGVLRALDRFGGTDEERVANLGGRWWELRGDDLVAGPRVVLVDADEITRPEQE